MIRRILIAVTLVALLSIPATAITPRVASFGLQCAGDCNSDGAVTLIEVIATAAIYSGTTPLLQCSGADYNGDGRVTIGEVVRAVRSHRLGCD